jgi:hypothetical protein
MLPPRPAVDCDDSLPDVEPEPDAEEPEPPDALEPVPEPEPVEPVEPDEPVEPVDPVEPVEPDEPVDPVEPEAPEPDDDEPLPELDPDPMLLPPPMRAFFSTKPPLPDPPLADALLVSLLLELELEPDPSARCRHPVAVTELPVDELCVLDVGDCAAASAPHRATLLLSVIAHCQ